MSRTIRNRRTVPHGYVVRDSGKVFHVSDPNHEVYGHSYPTFRRSVFATERKAARKGHNRWFRNRCRHLLRNDCWETIPPFKGTSGWLTW